MIWIVTGVIFWLLAVAIPFVWLLADGWRSALAALAAIIVTAALAIGAAILVNYGITQ